MLPLWMGYTSLFLLAYCAVLWKRDPKNRFRVAAYAITFTFLAMLTFIPHALVALKIVKPDHFGPVLGRPPKNQAPR